MAHWKQVRDGCSLFVQQAEGVSNCSRTIDLADMTKSGHWILECTRNGNGYAREHAAFGTGREHCFYSSTGRRLSFAELERVA